MNVPQRIKVVQETLGLTQKEFAKGLDMKPGGLADWYYRHSSPRSDKLELIVQVYNANPVFLLTGKGKPVLKKTNWTEKDEARFNDRYKQMLFLVNNCGKSNIVRQFYDTLKTNNWKQALDQKLGKAIFGRLHSISTSFNISPNILLVEIYSELFYDILKYLSKGYTLRIDHIYILSEVCKIEPDEFQKIIPDNPFILYEKKEIYARLNYKSRIKFKIYDLKGFSQDSDTSNTAWQGIRIAFKQLDDMFRYQHIPNFCDTDEHNYFYWTKCHICEEKLQMPLPSFDEEFPNIDIK